MLKLRSMHDLKPSSTIGTKFMIQTTGNTVYIVTTRANGLSGLHFGNNKGVKIRTIRDMI